MGLSISVILNFRKFSILSLFKTKPWVFVPVNMRCVLKLKGYRRGYLFFKLLCSKQQVFPAS